MASRWKKRLPLFPLAEKQGSQGSVTLGVSFFLIYLTVDLILYKNSYSDTDFCMNVK